MTEVVRLYGLRMWAEQSYKQVKHVLEWSDYQERSNCAIRCNRRVTCLAFSFCWWAYGRLPASPEETAERPEDDLPSDPVASEEDAGVLAGGTWGGEGMAGTLGDAVALLESILRSAPPAKLKALLERVFSSRELYLCAR